MTGGTLILARQLFFALLALAAVALAVSAVFS
jgi:hypothetical protein